MRNIRTVLATVALLLSPGVALSLSCDTYSIEDAYRYHEGQDARYVLALGSFYDLRLIERVRTRVRGDEIRQGVTVYLARFKGFSPSRQAFDKPLKTEVRLVFPDFSIFGGGFDSAAAASGLAGTKGLVWLKETEAGYEVTADLCAPLIDTDPANVRAALLCLRGAFCRNR